MAETILTGPDTCREKLRQFTARHGFPMIAKPRLRRGLTGRSRPDYVIQPYLAPPSDLNARFFDPSEGWPLFHALVDDGQFAGQAIIGPDGEVTGGFFCVLEFKPIHE